MTLSEEITLVGLDPIAEREFGSWGMRGGKAPPLNAEQALTTTALSMASLLGLLRQGFKSEHTVEQASLGALQSLAILDTLPERQFDDLVELAKTLAGAEIAIISLIGFLAAKFILPEVYGYVDAEDVATQALSGPRERVLETP